jgi:hypothetical protein
MMGRPDGVGGGEADRHWQSITIHRARIFEDFSAKIRGWGPILLFCYNGLYSGAADAPILARWRQKFPSAVLTGSILD